MKFERPNSNIVPFGTNANENKRFAFGTNNYTNDINENLNDSFKLGWETVGINSKPPRQWFNGLAYTSTYLTSYLFQAGIPEWNDKQKYYINSIVMGSDGNIYRSLAGTEETPNVNNNPTLAGSVSWKSILSDCVKLTGNQTIAEVKTFTSSPIVPAPTTDFQAATKKYVDDNITPEYNPTPTIATGTATFNSTTNNINLTGIGLGVEVGDVIQISGADDAKNNSEFTVEVITDNDNIIVNQAHANKGTTKNVANRSGDTGVTVKLLAKWYNASDSLGRDWVDVKSSRAAGVNYPNNTNRGFDVEVVCNGTNTVINRVVGADSTVIANSSSGAWVIAPFKASKKQNYSIIVTAGSINSWKEYR